MYVERSFLRVLWYAKLARTLLSVMACSEADLVHDCVEGEDEDPEELPLEFTQVEMPYLPKK